MTKRRSSARRSESLSLTSIVAAAVELLNEAGEEGLTFQALAARLSTGAGAIYWHVPNKHELLIAACDTVIIAVVERTPVSASPAKALRAFALTLYDALHEHPWVGTALTRAAGQLPMIRILERIGQHVRALRVPRRVEWSTVSALLHYVLGVAGQHAANGQLARLYGLERGKFLAEVAATWSQLDPETYPFTRGSAEAFEAHDDRADFIAGIDLIIRGMTPTR